MATSIGVYGSVHGGAHGGAHGAKASIVMLFSPKQGIIAYCTISNGKEFIAIFLEIFRIGQMM